MTCSSGFGGSVARLLTWLSFPLLLSSLARADTTRVFVEAPSERVYLPHGLSQPVPLADSGFHRVPGCVFAPEFEAACLSYGAVDISRAFALSSDADTIHYNPSGEPINVSFMRNWYVVRIPDTVSMGAFVGFLKDSLGLWAEPPFCTAPNSAQILEPQDPIYYSVQRKYLGTGYIPGRWARMLELPKAWGIHTGDPGVKIGVFDFGVDRNHVDLNDKPISGHQSIAGAHGTMVASIIYGDVNDEDGRMAGVNWNATRAAYFVSEGANAFNAQTLTGAWTDGCQLINCSFYLTDGNPDHRVYSALFHQAAASVRMAGGIIIAGAGNTGTGGNLDESPAEFPEAISVAAINKYALRWPYSTAREWVDFAAPGDSVWVAHYPSSLPDSLLDSIIHLPPGGGLGYVNPRDSIQSGTSFAAPHVTGIASLLYSYALTQGYTLNDQDDIYNLLRLSADPLGVSVWNPNIGWGMPKLDSAYWLVTKPNSIERFVVNSGWTEAVTDYYPVKMTGMFFSPETRDLYLVKRHDVQRWVDFPRPYHVARGAWVRGRTSIGAGVEGTIAYPTKAGKVLEWTNDGCVVGTSWYEVYRFPYPGQYLGNYPCNTGGINLDVAVVGELKLLSPTLHAYLSDPSKVTVWWGDPNNIESGQTLYRRVGGSTTNYTVPLGSGSRDFADTLASTPYKYWINIWNVHQNVLSDTLRVKHPPRSPDNIQATVLLGDPDLLPLPKLTVVEPDLVPTNKVRVSWQHSPSQPSGTLAYYLVEVDSFSTYSSPFCPGECVDTLRSFRHIGAGRTDTVLCLHTSRTYDVLVMAVDVYGDTNVARPRRSVTTGNLDYCTIDIPICDRRAVPERFELSQNSPNPFNAGTAISFGLPDGAEVRLVVYDVLGRRVRNLLADYRSAGYHIVTWDGRDEHGSPVASGMYFYRLAAGEFTQTKKMVLLK